MKEMEEKAEENARHAINDEMKSPSKMRRTGEKIYMVN